MYLIARGEGMASRARAAALEAKRETDDYIRQAAGRSAAQEIADAKAPAGRRSHHAGRVRFSESQGAQLVSATP